MKGRRHTPEQVVRKLREADRQLAEGAELPDVSRQLEISIQTYRRWRSQYKAMRPEDVVRLKQLEKENARLKRLLAEKELDVDMLLQPHHILRPHPPCTAIASTISTGSISPNAGKHPAAQRPPRAACPPPELSGRPAPAWAARPLA